MRFSENLKTNPWMLLGFLTVLNVINFVDRQLISSLAVPIKKELDFQGWDPDMAIALLSGYAFALLYSAMGLVLGIISDHWSRTRLIAVGLFLWSAMTAASGMAVTFPQMALARVFVGIGEATLTPAALSMLGDVFHRKKHSLASGVYYLGLPFGASLSLIIAGTLGPKIGWRNCFYALGVLGVACSGLVWLIREPRHHLQDLGTPQDLSVSHFLKNLASIPGTLFRSPALLVTMAGGCLLNFSVGTITLDMLWLVEDRKLNPQYAAFWTGIVFLLGGTLGNVFGGALGDKLQHNLGAHRLWSVIGALLVCVPMMLVFRLSTANTAWFWIGYFFVSIGVTIYYGPVFSTVQELAPSHQRSMILAFFLIGMNLLGVSLGALVAAALKERLQDRTMALILTGLVCLGAIPCFLYVIRKCQSPASQPPLVSGN